MSLPPIENTAASLAALAAPGEALSGAGPDLTRYATVCALLLGAIAVLAWAFRRLFAGGLRARAARRSLRVVDVLPLGAKRSLAVVQCYDRTFLLGLGDKDVALLTELDLEAEATVPARRPERSDGAARPRVAAAPADEPDRTFGAALRSALADRPDERSRASRAEGILRALRRGVGVLG